MKKVHLFLCPLWIQLNKTQRKKHTIGKFEDNLTWQEILQVHCTKEEQTALCTSRFHKLDIWCCNYKSSWKSSVSPSLSNNLVVRESQSKVCHLLLLLLFLLLLWWCLLEIHLLHHLLLLLHLNHPQQQILLPHHEALHNGLDPNLVCNRILNPLGSTWPITYITYSSQVLTKTSPSCFFLFFLFLHTSSE